MDNTTNDRPTLFRVQQFRAPSKLERSIGLWVDRIGKRSVAGKEKHIRILGQYCFVQVLKGSGFYRSNAAGEIPVKEGDCMLQFPSDPCLYQPYESWTTCWVTWNGAEGQLLEKLGYMNPLHPVFQDPEGSVWRAFTALTPIIHREDAAAVLRRKTITLEMVESAFRAANYTPGRTQQDALMQRAIALIHKNFNTRLSVDQLAASLNLSTTHFRRIFHAYTGKSPIDFLLSIRMAEARHLLLDGMSIKQVALAVGYEDLFYFMRVFRKTVGMPPGKFSRIGGTLPPAQQPSP